MPRPLEHRRLAARFAPLTCLLGSRMNLCTVRCTGHHQDRATSLAFLAALELSPGRVLELHERVRVGRSDNPDSSMKAIGLPWAEHFFERRPGLALPLVHGRIVALDGAPLGLLRAEAHAAQYAPDMYFAESDAIQALDERAHPLERPQLSTRAVRQCPLQQHRPQTLSLPGVELPRPPDCHRPQGIDVAFIKPSLPDKFAWYAGDLTRPS